ncbi:MAG: hypothetical protein ACKOBO_01205 [Acidimicrobiales bacterium]
MPQHHPIPLRALVAALATVFGSVITVAVGITPVSAEPFTYVDVSTGYHAACAVSTDGAGLCWGWNRNRALGTENTDEKVMTPSRIVLPDGARFASIEAGEYATTCGIDTDAQVWCWGEHHLGSYFNPTSTRPVRVELPAGTRAAQMSNGASIACAVSTVRELWCWGDVLDFGNGSTEATRTPERVPMPDGSPVTNVQVGPANTCAVTATGNLWCWGTNDDGEVGIGYRSAKVSLPAKVPLPEGVVVSSVSVGLDRICALSTQGGGWCWGDNYEGALGDGTYTDSPSPRAVVVPADESLALLDTAWYHTCAITVSGITWCWGRGGFGELGTGTTLGGRTFRQPVLPAGTVLSTLSAGLATTCGIDTAGHVWCWTGSDWGVAGSGDSTKSLFPRLTAAVGTPTVSAPGVPSVGAESAVVRASVNPQGARSTWSVQVSTDASFAGATTVAGSPVVAAGWSAVAVQVPLTGLAPRTRHWVRLVASNTFGTSTGASVPFDTLGSEPTVGTPTTGPVSGTRATVSVSVDPGLLRTTARIEWSTAADFSTSSSVDLAPVTADDRGALRSAVIDGLAPRTTYRVRAVATNRLGATMGDVTTFVTAGSEPRVSAVKPTAGVRAVTVNASIDGGSLAGTATAVIARTDAPDRVLDTVLARWDEAGPAESRFVFDGLAPRTRYSVTVTATNALGSHAHDAVAVNTAGDVPDPGVAVIDTTGSDSALVRVEVNPSGLDTSVVLEVSTDAEFATGVTEHFVGLVTGDQPVRRSVRINGLAPRTRHHVRVRAANELGKVTGGSTSFLTATPVGVLVNDDDPTTDSPVVTLTVTAPAGTAVLRIANNAAMTGARVLANTATVPWQLEPAGTERSHRTVWVQFLGRNGRVLSTASDSIDLLGDGDPTQPDDPDAPDDAAPVLSFARLVSASASGVGRGTGPRASGAGRALRSGISRVAFRSGRRVTVHRVSSVSSLNRSFTVPSRSSLWVRLVDAAGNASRWMKVRGS